MYDYLIMPSFTLKCQCTFYKCTILIDAISNNFFEEWKPSQLPYTISTISAFIECYEYPEYRRCHGPFESSTPPHFLVKLTQDRKETSKEKCPFFLGVRVLEYWFTLPEEDEVFILAIDARLQVSWARTNLDDICIKSCWWEKLRQSTWAISTISVLFINCVILLVIM